MIRLLKWLFWVILAILLLVALMLWLVDTDWGHRQIARQISAQRLKSGLIVEIGRINGSIFNKVTVDGLKLSDPKGLFLEVPSVRLDWRPKAWLANRLEINSLNASDATLFRLPKFRKNDTKRPILPAFDIVLGQLDIERLQIEDDIAGERRIGRVTGSLIARQGRALVNLDVDAAMGDRVELKLDAEPEQNKFDLAGTIAGPAGGVVGALLGTAQRVAMIIAGDGNWNQWRGSGMASLGGARVADLALKADKGLFSTNGTLWLESLTHGKIQKLAGPSVKVRGEASLADRQLSGNIALLSAAMDVRGKGVIDLGMNRFANLLVDTRLLQPATLFPNMTGENVALKARFNGPFSSAAFDYLLTSPRIAFDKTGFENVRASGQGRLSRPPVQLPVKLSASQVTGIGTVAGGLLRNLVVNGVLQVTGKAITGDGLAFTSDKLSGKLGLFVDLKTGVYDVGVAGQLVRYLIPGLGIVDVKTELKVIPNPEGHGSRVMGRGQGWVRRFDNNFLSSLAGGLPTLETGLVRNPDGVLQLIGLKLKGPKISLIGNGLRRVDGSFKFDGSGTQAQYGPLKLDLDGRIERPKLDILLARPADALGLSNVRLLMDPGASGYVWKAEGRSTLGSFRGDGQLLLPKGSTATIDIAELVTSGMKASGRLQPVTGGFAGRLALAGGGVNGSLDLAPVSGAQKIEAHLKAFDAHFEGPPVILARRGQFDGTIILDPKGTTIEGTVSGQGLARGGISLARLAANLKLRNGVGEIKASFAGSRGRAFDLQTVAQISPNRWQLIGGGTIDRKAVSLNGPAILYKEVGGWRLSPVQLDFGGGKARVAGLFSDNANEVDASLAQMPLSIVDIFSPGLGLGGIANGSVSYRQAASGQPSGKADLKIRGLTRSGLVLTSQPIDMGLVGNLSSGVGGVRMIAVAGGREIGRAQAQLQVGNSGSLYDRFASAVLFGQIRYSGSADALWRLSGVETLDVSGPISLGADVTGRLNDPIIRGSIRTTNARIESPATGMVLTNVATSGRFGNGSQLVFENISATAGKEGRISGKGTVDLSSTRGFAINLNLNADRATLIARDDLGAVVTGPVRIMSDGSEGVVSGDVTLISSRFRLGRTQSAQSLPRLSVREINGRADDAVPRRPVMPWRLALKARAADRLAVTGLGLSSEWSANLDIGGTPFAPTLRGRAELIRGDYDFAGRRFAVSRGTIRFQGENPPDPTIDVLAEGDTQGVNATIRVTGSGQKPEIRFASVPSLPEDELLSRLLFGTSITNLSAPEAVQLAAAVASLRNGGDGLNPINAVRKAIGLDRLRILPADSNTGQGTSLAAGKYLSRRAYVELISDGRGYSATRAEFQVTRWLSLLSTISTIGRQSAALRVSKDY